MQVTRSGMRTKRCLLAEASVWVWTVVLAADESREREQMKNTTLTITFNTEKLDALFFHWGKRMQTFRKN